MQTAIKLPLDEKESGRHVMYMAFCYLPSGLEIYSGGFKVIADHLRNKPLHHAWIISYVNGKKFIKRPFLFGQSCANYSISRRISDGGRRFFTITKFGKDSYGTQVIAKIRHLPNKHLNCLK
jgi:hypothetical protein